MNMQERLKETYNLYSVDENGKEALILTGGKDQICTYMALKKDETFRFAVEFSASFKGTGESILHEIVGKKEE